MTTKEQLSTERLDEMLADCEGATMVGIGGWRYTATVTFDTMREVLTLAKSALRGDGLSLVRTALNRAEAFASDYEFDSDEGCHTPSDIERMLMLDMLNGLFDDEEFVKAITRPLSAISLSPAGGGDACGTCGGTGEIDQFAGGGWPGQAMQHVPCPDCATLSQPNTHEGEAVAWRPTYEQIIELVEACRVRRDKAGESSRMMSKWISEGLNALYAHPPRPETVTDGTTKRPSNWGEWERQQQESERE
ncbi:MAG TPA: hypothetical protein VGN60_07770 [Devosia sp.]|jgi:hypothetical protein|nr:hypothetical protein [Devosia sp.]